MNMTKVFVVILNWNGWKDTVECLKSIYKLKVKNFELFVVVVDNASTDDSVMQLKKYNKKNKHKNLKIITCSNNLGYTGGNNVGISYAMKKKADFVMVLNNDTVVDPNLIIEFLKTARKYPKVGIISPKIYFAKGYEFHNNRYKNNELGKVIWSAGGEMDWDNVFGRNRGVDEVDQGQYDEVEEVEFATGTCMFLRAQTIKDIGKFDEKYFMYFEDVDLSQKALKNEWQIIYQPKALIWHKVGRSSAIGSNLNDYFITRNRLLFGLRYAPSRSFLALVRESIRLLATGRKWQKLGVFSYYLRNFGKGGWNEEK